MHAEYAFERNVPLIFEYVKLGHMNASSDATAGSLVHYQQKLLGLDPTKYYSIHEQISSP